MPLNLPSRLPAVEILKSENIFVMDSQQASTQDIRPLRIVILNLMPLKITTETDLDPVIIQYAIADRGGSFLKMIGPHIEKYSGRAHDKRFIRTLI